MNDILKTCKTSSTQHDLVFTLEPAWHDISDQVMRLEEEIFEQELRFTPEEFAEDFLCKGSCFIMARFHEKPVGYLHAIPLDELDYLSFDSEYGLGTTIYIENVAILQEFRGHDIAGAMFWMLRDITSFRRFTAHAVNDISIKFFRKMGFQDSLNFPNWMNGRDALYMIR